MEKYEKILELAVEDTSLLDELKGMTAADAVASLQKKGCDLTEDEYMEVMSELAKQESQSDELGDEDLTQVAGGCRGVWRCKGCGKAFLTKAGYTAHGLAVAARIKAGFSTRHPCFSGCYWQSY